MEMTTEFPFLIFRKACFFCQKFDACKESDPELKETDICSDFVLKEEYSKFLSVEIFDEVERVWRGKRKEVSPDA